jgi:hypothetical protein
VSVSGSVTHWIRRLEAGEEAAFQKLWEVYFRRLVGLARQRLRGTPHAATDEEDVALSAFDSFYRVGLVQVVEVAGRLAQAHPPGHDLVRQGKPGLFAAPVGLDAEVQILAALDPPGDGQQVAVHPSTPAGKD